MNPHYDSREDLFKSLAEYDGRYTNIVRLHRQRPATTAGVRTSLYAERVPVSQDSTASTFNSIKRSNLANAAGQIPAFHSKFLNSATADGVKRVSFATTMAQHRERKLLKKKKKKKAVTKKNAKSKQRPSSARRSDLKSNEKTKGTLYMSASRIGASNQTSQNLSWNARMMRLIAQQKEQQKISIDRASRLQTRKGTLRASRRNEEMRTHNFYTNPSTHRIAFGKEQQQQQQQQQQVGMKKETQKRDEKIKENSLHLKNADSKFGLKSSSFNSKHDEKIQKDNRKISQNERLGKDKVIESNEIGNRENVVPETKTDENVFDTTPSLLIPSQSSPLKYRATLANISTSMFSPNPVGNVNERQQVRRQARKISFSRTSTTTNTMKSYGNNTKRSTSESGWSCPSPIGPWRGEDDTKIDEVNTEEHISKSKISVQHMKRNPMFILNKIPPSSQQRTDVYECTRKDLKMELNFFNPSDDIDALLSSNRNQNTSERNEIS
eukprot:g1951.t1